MNKPEETTVKRKALKKCPAVGVVHINATFNNTLITITDTSGNAIFSSSAGKKGFKGARKSTPFAAQVAAAEIAQFAYDGGMRTVSVEVSGPGGGRESAMRALSTVGLRVTQLKDITPVPHNGCRPPKKRRV